MNVDEVKDEINEGLASCRGAMRQIARTIDLIQDTMPVFHRTTNGASNQLVPDAANGAASAVDMLQESHRLLSAALRSAAQYRDAL